MLFLLPNQQRKSTEGNSTEALFSDNVTNIYNDRFYYKKVNIGYISKM